MTTAMMKAASAWKGKAGRKEQGMDLVPRKTLSRLVVGGNERHGNMRW